MTDLRAAFGLEDTTGPILGLLNENDYDDVFILCHTQKGKDAPSDFSTELEKNKSKQQRYLYYKRVYEKILKYHHRPQCIHSVAT